MCPSVRATDGYMPSSGSSSSCGASTFMRARRCLPSAASVAYKSRRESSHANPRCPAAALVHVQRAWHARHLCRGPRDRAQFPSRRHETVVISRDADTDIIVKAIGQAQNVTVWIGNTEQLKGLVFSFLRRDHQGRRASPNKLNRKQFTRRKDTHRCRHRINN